MSHVRIECERCLGSGSYEYCSRCKQALERCTCPEDEIEGTYRSEPCQICKGDGTIEGEP